MVKKRKSDVDIKLDEVDRTMYSSFCSAANSLSHLYTQAMNQQKLVFNAGERQGLEKVYQWILRQKDDGTRVTGEDVLAYLQNELDYGEDMMPTQHTHSQPTTHFTNPSVQMCSTLLGQTTIGHNLRSLHGDQAKNSVFSNALSSPVRRGLQPYHLAQGGGSAGNGGRNTEMNAPLLNRGESNSNSSNDSSMDMHPDSPGHESY
ncbi:hypothetical protein QJS04_geneDACA005475 [Acorus gramineus]|uniref:Holocarboxylase synthetase n=1 Tax=Acorus gramineus TaxID=55184 RepID=A0AAV9A6Q8_ACOGR|nr:hypothetical protein QJS04_geneDACA005475 [Acorus gramineus]